MSCCMQSKKSDSFRQGILERRGNIRVFFKEKGNVFVQ